MGKNAFSVKIGIFFFQLEKRGVDLCHTAHPKGECEEPSHWMIAGGKFGVWQMSLMWPLETLPLAKNTSRPYSQGLQVTTETCLHMDLSSVLPLDSWIRASVDCFDLLWCFWPNSAHWCVWGASGDAQMPRVYKHGTKPAEVFSVLVKGMVCVTPDKQSR